jgi:hypothetical protein
MKKIILTLFLLISLNIIAFSQEKEKGNDKANFNGTWVIDKDKSTNDGKLWDNYFLIIAFKDNQFKITKVFVSGKKAGTYELTLVTDKSGEKNKYIRLDGSVERTSKTYWQKNTLVSEYKSRNSDKKYTLGGTEKYYLSKDGKKLFVESVQTSPAVPFGFEDLLKSRLVFRRKE